tara:strand:+ start:174 stop:422 length:249 start_codon:yes stop_codon:yes gene_type:complete
MSEERKAENFPLPKPDLGSEPKTDKDSYGYKMMMESYERGMAEYNDKLERWLAGEEVAGVSHVVVPDGEGGTKEVSLDEDSE